MTALARIDQTALQEIGASRITEIFECKIYYVIRGRNAWHSTWVTHYFNNCMHDELRSAKNQAERWRERGAVFTIREQPALAFRSKKATMLITEINTPTPLSNWIKRYRNEKSDFKLNQNYCRLEPLFSKVRTIKTLIGSLADRNIFPDFPPDSSDNIFVLSAPVSEVLNGSRKTHLKEWQSSSYGGDFLLNWDEKVSKISGKAVRRVADALEK